MTITRDYDYEVTYRCEGCGELFYTTKYFITDIPLKFRSRFWNSQVCPECMMFSDHHEFLGVVVT